MVVRVGVAEPKDGKAKEKKTEEGKRRGCKRRRGIVILPDRSFSPCG